MRNLTYLWTDFSEIYPKSVEKGSKPAERGRKPKKGQK